MPRIGKEETTILSNNISKGLFRTIKINFSSWVLLVPSLFIMFVILWQPIFSGFYLSLFKMKGYDPIQFVGLKNFFDVMSDGAFLQTLMNTFFYVIWSIVIGFLPPILIAVVLNEMVHFKSYFKFAVYFPSMVPGIAAALLWYFIFQPGDGGILNMLLSKIGIANSQWLQDAKMTIPLIVATMTWKGFGPAVILYMASLQGVGQDHYEAATIDGAGIWKRFVNITLPPMYGIVLLMFVRQIIAVFQVMVEPLAMTDGGPNNASMTLSLQGYFYAFRYFQADKALALGVITFLILVLFTIFYFVLEKRVGDN